MNSAADTGGTCSPSACTLRAAIAAANGSAGADLITFNIAPGGPQTITVGAGAALGLPSIKGDDITIDGTTQPGGGAYGIRLDDPDSDGGESGLLVDGQRTTIRGLAVTRFDTYGIYLRSTAHDAVIVGSLVGTADGVAAQGTANDGIHVKGGGGNRIGGSADADRNVVSGSAKDGIELEDSSDNVVSGNYVGVTADGVGRLPNLGMGIRIDGVSQRNRVGGPSAGERNVVSGNNGIGVQILGSMRTDGTCETPEQNVVAGNYVGVNVNGTKPSGGTHGNFGEGVQLSTCARANMIGGTTPEARNVVAGNRADGIELDSSGGPGGPAAVCGNTVQGNYIGTDPTGMRAVPNVDDGVGIDNGACDNLVGGTEPGAGNLIAGSSNDGVDISRPGSTGNTVRGNVIGLAADGDTPLGHGQNGVHIRDRAAGNLVTGNTISANAMSGVLIEHAQTNANTVRDNSVGGNVAGNAARGNKRYGIWLYDGPQANVIDGNRIEGNSLDGVAVERLPTSTVATVRNRITRTTTRSNGGLGIDLLPTDGPNPNDGNNADPTVGDNGLDTPVITEATSISATGTAPAGATVEVFAAIPGGDETSGEGADYLGADTADAFGVWCLRGVSIGGPVTATAIDSQGNTSEPAVNANPSGDVDLCSGITTKTLFADDFTAPDGSAPSGWDVRRSATGTGAGATVQANQLAETVALASGQDGTWQYVQAREASVQPSWASATISFQWQMATAANNNQTVSLVLTPSATTGNATSQPDYLRVFVRNRILSVVTRAAGGTAATVWSGTVPSSTDLRDFELRVDASSLRLYEGPAGSATLRVGPIAHGLGFSTGHLYLQGSTMSATSPFTALFDRVRLLELTCPGCATP